MCILVTGLDYTYLSPNMCSCTSAQSKPLRSPSHPLWWAGLHRCSLLLAIGPEMHAEAAFLWVLTRHPVLSVLASVAIFNDLPRCCGTQLVRSWSPQIVEWTLHRRRAEKAKLIASVENCHACQTAAGEEATLPASERSVHGKAGPDRRTSLASKVPCPTDSVSPISNTVASRVSLSVPLKKKSLNQWYSTGNRCNLSTYWVILSVINFEKNYLTMNKMRDHRYSNNPLS